MDSQQCLWFSRFSFGVSVVALMAGMTGACSQKESSLSAEQGRTSQLLAPNAADRDGNGVAKNDVQRPGAGDADGPRAVLTVEELPKAAPEETAKLEPKARAKDEAKKPDTADSAAVSSLECKRLVVTTRIDAREPVATDTFELGGQPVMAFVELTNPTDQELQVVVTFEPVGGGEKVGFVELSVPAKSPRWRTWGSTRRIDKAGEWTASVAVKDGPVLASTVFSVSEASPPNEASEALASK
jgi:hypothetical protein